MGQHRKNFTARHEAKRSVHSPFIKKQIRKNFIARDHGFTCQHCAKKVERLGKGYRNHCPYCLYSVHVDAEVPGDRASTCHGLMKPIRLERGNRKGYLGFDVVHRCERCKKEIKNLLAEGDRWSAIKND